jgi:hypothetical protein
VELLRWTTPIIFRMSLLAGCIAVAVARHHIETAMKISPNDADALMNAAMVRAHGGEPQAALDIPPAHLRRRASS